MVLPTMSGGESDGILGLGLSSQEIWSPRGLSSWERKQTDKRHVTGTTVYMSGRHCEKNVKFRMKEMVNISRAIIT
jgi:hypothetical protein